MKQKLLDRLTEIQKTVVQEHFNVDKLTQLREETKAAFNDFIDQTFLENGLVKKIQVPSKKLKLWPGKSEKFHLKINFCYLISSPFIYGMIFPALVWHLSIEIYHQICFRLYGIPLVKASEYFINDRQLLSWLNWFEKINCIYCSYVNNLIRYSSEIGGRTERYWCPIKYYRRINNPHSQYNKFVANTNPAKLHQQWEELRDFSDITEK